MNKLEQLEEKHLETLLKHKHFYDLFKATGELVNFSHEVQNELLEIYRISEPYYQYNNRCDACVVTFLVNLYNKYNEQLHP